MAVEWQRRSAHGRPPKHAPIPGHDRRQTVSDTSGGNPARYFPGVDAAALERRVIDEGTDVPSGKPATYYRMLMHEDAIGASGGSESRWVLVESTNGEYHGRSITLRRFEELLARAREGGRK